MTRDPAHCRRRRRRILGVTTVEFALVAPFLFAVIFGTIDGGLMLFSGGALNHSVNLVMIGVAQEGNLATADTDAITSVQTQGFGASGFAKIDEIDIYRTVVDGVTGAVSQDTTPDASCGNRACIDRYDINGVLLNPLLDRTAPWKPGSRQTALSSLTTAGVTIMSHYNYLAFNASRLNIVDTRFFQLEPQS